MTDLVIRGIKSDDGFLSWKEPSGEQFAVDLHKVEAIQLPINGERPILKCGSGSYFPPMPYAEIVDLWSKSTRNQPRKIGY